MLPNFLVIGAQKSGTTSLCSLLGQHPEVFMSDPKEPHFFSSQAQYSEGVESYERYFSSAEPAKAVGEGSTSYAARCLHPQVSERVAKHLPHAKLIYIVRHPVARARSAWLHYLREGRDLPLQFETALRSMEQLLGLGRYMENIDAYRRFFADEQILVLFFEEFVAAPDTALERCFEFLGVERSFRCADVHSPRNASGGTAIDGKAARLIKRFPGARTLVGQLPAPMRHLGTRLLRARINLQPGISAETMSWVDSQIGEDTRAFLSHFEKPVDYWRLDKPV